MKTKAIVLSMLLIAGGHSSHGNSFRITGSDESMKATEFTLEKTVSGVSIYTRWIPADASRLGKQVKAEFIVKSSVADVLLLLQRDSAFTTWMNGTSRYYRVKSVNETQWFSYVQFAIPWPFNNQDCIIRYEVQPGQTAHCVKVKMTGMPFMLKSFDGVKRIRHMEGWWILTRLNETQTRVEYIMFSNQKPEFPRWITDPIIQKSLVKTMSSFRTLAELSK
jgi:hypothetical protein